VARGAHRREPPLPPPPCCALQTNSPVTMATCGSKVDSYNICQMVAMVGQQIVGGKRITEGFVEPHAARLCCQGHRARRQGTLSRWGGGMKCVHVFLCMCVCVPTIKMLVPAMACHSSPVVCGMCLYVWVWWDLSPPRGPTAGLRGQLVLLGAHGVRVLFHTMGGRGARGHGCARSRGASLFTPLVLTPPCSLQP